MWCSAVGCIVTLTLSLLAAPLAAEAQPAGEGPRIGLLSRGSPGSLGPDSTPSGKGCASWATWRARTSPLSTAWPKGKLTGSPSSRPSWSVSRSTSSWRRVPGAIRAAKQATTTIPIVMAAAAIRWGRARRQPRAAGREHHGAVPSCARDLSGKRLELLKEAVPTVSPRGRPLESPRSASTLECEETQTAAAGAWACSCNPSRCGVPTISTAPSPR